MDLQIEGKVVCDFNLRNNGQFLVYSADTEIEGILVDDKFTIIGRRPCSEPRLHCKVLEKPERIIYQIGFSNDIEMMELGSRHLSKRLVGIRDSEGAIAISADDLGKFVLSSETESTAS